MFPPRYSIFFTKAFYCIFFYCRVIYILNTFDEVHTKTERLSTSTELDDELEERDKIETTFSNLTSLAHDIVAPSNISLRHSAEVTASSRESNVGIQTKHIKLPTKCHHDGKDLKWLGFRDFDSLTHQPNIGKWFQL